MHGLRSLPRCAATRERELVRATRALFDERGLQDAPIEEIARAVGIARGLIYRQFSSKEELYVLTVTDYLAELDGLLGEATSPDLEPGRAARGVGARLRRLLPALPGLPGLRAVAHAPAGRRAARGAVGLGVAAPRARGSRAAWSTSSEILRAGARDGTFAVEDPDYMANVLWTQVLGATHLARIRVGVRQAAPGIPELFTVAPEQLARHLRGQRAGDRRRPAVKLGPVEPQLRSVAATRYVEPLREGGSLPGLMEADDDGLYVAKYRGAGQGPAALVAEVVVGELARRLGLPVPELVTLALPRRAGAGRARPRDPGPALRQRRASTSASTSCRARCRSRRPPWPRSIPSWRPTSCGSTR